MAVINVSPSDDLAQAMLDASQGDHLALAGGNWPAFSRQSPIVKNGGGAGFAGFGANVTLRPADRNNPPVWNTGRFDVKGLQGFTFDGLWFHGTAVEATIGGVQYPDLREALRFYDCKNIKLVNCSIKFHLSQLRVTNCDFFEIARNRFWQTGIDAMMFYNSSRDIWIHHNVINDTRTDASRRNEADRHADVMQFRTGTSQVGSNPFRRVVVEDNYADRTSAVSQGVFTNNQGGIMGIGSVDMIVRRNSFILDNSLAIAVSGQQNVLVTGNRLRAPAGTSQSMKPRIFIYRTDGSGTITNNVMAASFQLMNGASLSSYTNSGNVVSDTANPSGWTELVPGVNVGPYTDGDASEPTAPVRMTDEWADPPTNSVSKDGRIGSVTEVSPGRYTGEAIIPTASVAASAMATNPTTPGTPVDNLEWTRTGLSAWKPFRVANPAINGAGWRRYEMTGGPGDAASVYTVGPGETMDGITLRYKANGIASEASSYTVGFTAPGEPPPPAELDPLAADDWEIFSVVDALLPGRSTARIKITGVTYTGAQWTIDGESVWRPLVQVGEDGGAAVLQLEPSAPGGSEHTVGYAGAADDTLAIRVRYSVDIEWGPESATAKSFTGPTAPTVIGDEGGFLVASGVPLRAAGFPLVVAAAGVPPPPVAEGSAAFADGDGTVTVTLSAPIGATGVRVLYAGQAYDLDGTQVSFPAVIGEETVYAHGVTADGTAGILGFWPVLDAPEEEPEEPEEPDPWEGITTIKRLVATVEEEWNVSGYTPGDAMQQWQAVHWCMAEPDYVYSVQDAGGLWASRNGGKSWFLPARTGIGSYQCNGVAVDPVDPLRVLVNASGGNYPVNVPYRGLYASTDGAMSFGPRIVEGGGDNMRGTHSAMAWAPGSVGATRAEKWLAIADGTNGPTAVPIMASTNGWGSWTQRGTWNKTLYGSTRFMAGDPTSDNRFYVAATGGLVRITNAFSGTIAFTLLSGSGGLPAGSVGGRPYVSADGQTIIVGISDGIYKSTNGGSTWTKVGTEGGFTRLEVNPYNPAHMVLLYAESNSQQLPKYSTNGGTTFTATRAADVEMRGTLSYTPLTQYNYAHVAWHSTPGRWFMAGRQTHLPQAANHYRTIDHGQHLLLANEGVCGWNHSLRQCAPSLWGGDKYTFALSAQDMGVGYTKNGGKWFQPRTLTTAVVGEHPSCYGIAVHPDPAKKTVLAAVGNNSVTLWGSHDDTVTWGSKQALGGKYYSVFFGNDPQYAFAGRYRSTNHGQSFSAMTGLPSQGAVVDKTRTGSTVWAIDAADKKGIWRSTNNGGSWAKVHTLARACTNNGTPWGPFAAHPSDPDVFFSMGANDQSIARYDIDAGTITQLPFYTGSPSYVTPVCAQHIAVDPRFPDVIYVSTLYAGSPRVYVTTDGGATWTPITELPQHCNFNALTVSPYTGEVLTGGSNGMHLMAPPYAQSGLIMDELPYGAYVAAA